MTKSKMAEETNFHQNLPETFKEIWKYFDILEKTEESTSSDKVQGYVYHACETCKKAIKMVNNLDLFSKNEEIEEVASVEIKYLLLPALMGYFLMKNSVRDRLKVVTESKDFYTDYLRMCSSYNVTTYEVSETNDANKETQLEVRPAHPAQRPSPADLRGMAGQRNSKVQRFNEQKEIERKLHDLKEMVEQDHVDDEVKRDYYLTLLRRWVNICIDELDSIAVSCEYNGNSYNHGQRFKEGGNCRKCQCKNGEITCKTKKSKKCSNVLCNKVNCAQLTCPITKTQSNLCCPLCDGGDFGSCEFAATRYPDGDRFDSDDDCNRCICVAGEVTCSDFDCPDDCEYDDVEYDDGDEFEGLNDTACMCRNGYVKCLSTHCLQYDHCNISGMDYCSGGIFFSDDHCRVCRCRNGFVLCMSFPCGGCQENGDFDIGEVGILELMAKKKGDKSHQSPKKVDHKPEPLRPFIITKDLIQKQVYGLGYPGLPTMTIEEFFDKKVEEGTLHINEGGHSMEDWAKDPEKDKIVQEEEEAEKEERFEKEDPGELMKARNWDEYKDDHRRGWGNRQNRH